ncbi:MAG: ArnT family glycosyltransferase [Thermodesulfobacteriota bacterium]
MKKELIFWRELILNTSEIEGKIGVWKHILILFIFAFLLRLPLLLYPEVIHNDGTVYIQHARKILSGDWSIGNGNTHPFYPLLIAIAHYFSPNDELAGIGISVLFGSLLIITVFYLGSNLYNERVGLYSSLFASIHPSLYIYSGSVLTESTFYFLLATSVLFGWRAFEKGKFRDILLFSFFVSLSYLTRIEGIGFLLLFGAWILFISPPHRERSYMTRGRIVFVALCLFLVFSSPYLMQIKKETGKWQISKKISIVLGSISKEEAEEAILKIKERKAITISSFIKSPLTALEKIIIGGFRSLYKFQQVFTPYLFIIALIGLWLSRKKSSTFKGNLYLLSYIFYLLCFIHPLFRAGRRYATHVIPIVLPWAAVGFLKIIDWVQKSVKSRDLKIKISFLLVIVILTSLFIQGRIIHRRDHRAIQKEAGLWIKDHLPKGSKLMSRMPQEAFYGELEWVRIPSGSSEEILVEAFSKKVQYLLIDHEVLKMSPDFLKQVDDKGYELVKEIEKKNQWIKIFRLHY